MQQSIPQARLVPSGDAGLEVMEPSEDLFEFSAPILFARAENRMHTIRAMLVARPGD